MKEVVESSREGVRVCEPNQSNPIRNKEGKLGKEGVKVRGR